MSDAVQTIDHPHINSHPGFCGGSPVIIGTRFPVRSVVNYVLRQGLTPEELISEFSHLTLAQVYDALSFYYDHQELIDQDLASNSESRLKSG